jgi:hypothetical protein
VIVADIRGNSGLAAAIVPRGWDNLENKRTSNSGARRPKGGLAIRGNALIVLAGTSMARTLKDVIRSKASLATLGVTAASIAIWWWMPSQPMVAPAAVTSSAPPVEPDHRVVVPTTPQQGAEVSQDDGQGQYDVPRVHAERSPTDMHPNDAEEPEIVAKQQDPRYQQMKQNAAAWRLSDADIEHIYAGLMAYENGLEEIRNGANFGRETAETSAARTAALSDESVRSLRDYLGDERFELLMRNGIFPFSDK